MSAMIKDLNNSMSKEAGVRERATIRREALPNPPESDVVRFAPGVNEFKERRRRRRVTVKPMYTAASVRVLSRRDGPLEGHVVNLSETGMVLDLDEMIPVGQAITVEFIVAGLGQMRHEEWPTFAVAGEVVRLDDITDFPQGPYRIAIRFVRIPTMVQAQIARYVVTQPEKQTA